MTWVQASHDEELSQSKHSHVFHFTVSLPLPALLCEYAYTSLTGNGTTLLEPCPGFKSILFWDEIIDNGKMAATAYARANAKTVQQLWPLLPSFLTPVGSGVTTLTVPSPGKLTCRLFYLKARRETRQFLSILPDQTQWFLESWDWHLLFKNRPSLSD